MKDQHDMNASSRMLTRLAIIIVIALAALVVGVVVAFGGEYYQTYRKDVCEWCGKKGTLFNKLDIHHFYNQAKHPLWKNIEKNTVTLHHNCQFVFHKCNFTNEVPEVCVLFGRTTNEIINACIIGTGSVNGKGVGK